MVNLNWDQNLYFIKGEQIVVPFPNDNSDLACEILRKEHLSVSKLFKPLLRDFILKKNMVVKLLLLLLFLIS